MQRVRLRTLDEAQNSEEYNRLQRVINPVFNKQTGHEDDSAKCDKDYFQDERLRKVGEKIARRRGFL